MLGFSFSLLEGGAERGLTGQDLGVDGMYDDGAGWV